MCSERCFPYTNDIYFCMHKVVTKNQKWLSQNIFFHCFSQYQKRGKKKKEGRKWTNYFLHTTNLIMWECIAGQKTWIVPQILAHQFVQKIYDNLLPDRLDDRKKYSFRFLYCYAFLACSSKVHRTVSLVQFIPPFISHLHTNL